jgi:predicted MPP superfamily phosphohydrolase
VVERVNALDPDLVALTGDLVDGSVAYLTGDIAPLGELRSRHGSYVCTGNHEYYSGVHVWLAHFAKLGMTPLVNEHRIIEHDGARMLVAGVTDAREGVRESGHESDPARAVAGAAPSDLALLLAHQPKSVLEAERVGIDVMIAGHTHGGQFFPWNFFAHLGQPYVAGLHRHGRTLIYVSCGTGYWGPPLRLGAPSEITLLRLVRPRGEVG